MRICLVGHFNDELDEGVRNVAKSLYKKLHCKKIDIKSIFWNEIRKCKPDIIHFVLTPTISGIITAKLISLINPSSKVIISAIHPSFKVNSLLRLFRVDLVLVQTKESELLFKSINFPTVFLSNGVDTEKFHPVQEEKKKLLRKKYAIPTDKYVILHLASLKRERNLEIFKKLQEEDDNYVLIVGRENETYDPDLKVELEDAGCEVRIEHFPNIEEIYNLSDCYLFPTTDQKACIETPLSVLEAMACNLPVVSTKFGSLNYIFPDVEGLIFVESENEFLNSISKIKKGIKIDTRKYVEIYSWGIITQELRDIYEELLH